MKNNTVETLWDRRDKLGIFAEIMEAAKGNQGKTRIMYSVNLSFTQVNDYLSFLTKMGFIEVHKENNRKTYETTIKGENYVKNYVEMSQLLSPQEVEAPVIMS